MTKQTKLSAKGQVVIPKDVRDRMGWSAGTELEWVDTVDGLRLRKPRSRARLSSEEMLARLSERIVYDGPRLPIEKLSWHRLDDDSAR